MLLQPFIDAVHFAALREPACYIEIIAVYFVISGSRYAFNSRQFEDI